MPVAFSLTELASEVNAWCAAHKVAPSSEQAGATVTERNIRFYRTLGLLDAPLGGAKGYGEKHLLQLVAVRVLQAQGVPLRRIRELLYGRSVEELREIRRRGVAESARAPQVLSPALPEAGELWRMIPLDDEFLLVSRRGAALSARQRAAILHALQPESPLTES